MRTILTATLLLLSATAHAQYVYSGGPHRVGDAGAKVRINHKDTRGEPFSITFEGTVIGDYSRMIPNGDGTDRHAFHYHVLVYRPRVYRLDKQGRDTFTSRSVTDKANYFVLQKGAPYNDGVFYSRPVGLDFKTDAPYRMGLDVYEERLDESILHWMKEALQCTEEGRALDAKVSQQLADLNARNDKSKQRLLTKEGWRDLAIEMALEAATAKASKAIPAGKADKMIGRPGLSPKDAAAKDLAMREGGRMFVEGVGGYSKGAVMASLETARADEGSPEKRGAVEAAKGLSAEYVKQQLKRGAEGEAAVSKLLVDIGAKAINGDPIAKAVFDASVDAAIEYGLPPAVGPLAKEAVELAKQLEGYASTARQARAANEKFSCALNALNFARSARDAKKYLEVTWEEKERQESERMRADLLNAPLYFDAGDGSGWNGGRLDETKLLVRPRDTKRDIGLPRGGGQPR